MELFLFIGYLVNRILLYHAYTYIFVSYLPLPIWDKKS